MQGWITVRGRSANMWSRTWFEGDGLSVLLVTYRCGWRARTLETSTSAYPASRCPAWRRPFHRASPESAPLLSLWVTSPPWAEPSCTQPIGPNQREPAWASNHVTDCGVSSAHRSLHHPTHHFTVDLVEVDLTHLLHHVLILKRHKSKTYCWEDIIIPHDWSHWRDLTEFMGRKGMCYLYGEDAHTQDSVWPVQLL